MVVVMAMVVAMATMLTVVMMAIVVNDGDADCSLFYFSICANGRRSHLNLAIFAAFLTNGSPQWNLARAPNHR